MKSVTVLMLLSVMLEIKVPWPILKHLLSRIAHVDSTPLDGRNCCTDAPNIHRKSKISPPSQKYS